MESYKNIKTFTEISTKIYGKNYEYLNLLSEISTKIFEKNYKYLNQLLEISINIYIIFSFHKWMYPKLYWKF